jgi:hypothetical protein
MSEAPIMKIFNFIKAHLAIASQIIIFFGTKILFLLDRITVLCL